MRMGSCRWAPSLGVHMVSTAHSPRRRNSAAAAAARFFYFSAPI
jgi:hypothetical protein